MDLGLKNKYALVTGASHGIGRAIALALASEDCNVAICARNQERVDVVVSEIQSKGVLALGVTCDVMNLSDIDKTIDQVAAEFKTLHILVNNVGGGGRWGDEDILKTKDEVWSEVYTKNALAAARFTVRALPYMQKQSWGRVITNSSIAAKEGKVRPWYGMAKAAEVSLMKNLSLRPELIQAGITFNTICPGAIMIPDSGFDQERKKDPDKFDQWVKENFPLGRLGTPDEVASLVTFICSEKASFLNGATIAIDGAESKGY